MLLGKQTWAGPGPLPTGAGSVQPRSRNEPTTPELSLGEVSQVKMPNLSKGTNTLVQSKAKFGEDQGSERICESRGCERSQSCCGELLKQ